MASGDKIYIADKPTLDNVKTTVDSIKSTTTTTNTNVSTIKTNTTNLVDRIGTTSNTGGTSNAGTLMAKSNKIITDIGIITPTINTIKSEVDVIGATADTGGGADNR